MKYDPENIKWAKTNAVILPTYISIYIWQFDIWYMTVTWNLWSEWMKCTPVCTTCTRPHGGKKLTIVILHWNGAVLLLLRQPITIQGSRCKFQNKWHSHLRLSILVFRENGQLKVFHRSEGCRPRSCGILYLWNNSIHPIYWWIIMHWISVAPFW